MKVFGIVNEEKYKGYTNSVKSLLNEVKDENAKEIIDVNSTTLRSAQKRIQNASEKEKVLIVSAGNIGSEIFPVLNKTQKSTQNIEYVLASDRYYNDLDLSKIGSISLVMPQNAINEYKKDAEKNPQTVVHEYPADLVAAPTKEDMLNRANDFEKQNPELTQKIKDMIHKDNADIFFVGGRVALPDGSFKENTPKIFARAAYDIAHKAPDGAVIVFHGLRSFTRGNKTIDLIPYSTFIEYLKMYMPEGKEFMLIGKALKKSTTNIGNGLISYANLLKKAQKPVTSGTDFYYPYNKEVSFPINPSQYGAAEYYFLLNEAVKAKLPLYATIEQMNFIPEALTLGATPDYFAPYQWELSVESNIQTYDKLSTEYEKNGKILDTQVSAFKKLLSSTEKNELALNKSLQNKDVFEKFFKQKTK